MDSARRNAPVIPPNDIAHQNRNAPPPDMLKLNVDDSSGQDNACAVIVCRDSQDRVKLAAVLRVVTPDPEHVEANTIHLRVKLATEFGDTSFIIVVDAKNLIHWICSKDSLSS